jgi:hypothetical protein
MCKKINWLAVEYQNSSKFYLVELKRVNLNYVSRDEKTRGGEMKESLAMLLKTNGEKMSILRSLAMSMKTSQLKSLSRDVNEKKAS